MKAASILPAHHLGTARSRRVLFQLMATLVATGVGAMMRVVVFPLFATQAVGLGLGAFGLLAAGTVLVSIVANLALGRLSDHIHDRQKLVALVCVWTGAGYLICWLHPSRPLLVVAALGCLSIASVAGPQLFALGSGHIQHQGHRRPGALMGVLRASLSIGVAVGPMLAALGIAHFGPRSVMLLAALPWALAALLISPRLAPLPPVPRRHLSPALASRAVVLFFTAFCLISLADVVRSGYLTVFATQELGIPVHQVGWLFGISSGLNLLLMPLAGVIADRVGTRAVVLVAAAAGALSSFGGAFAASSGAFMALAALHAVYLSGLYSVGLTSAQELGKGNAGFGIGVYAGALQLGALLGMLLGGVLAERAGWSWLFVSAGLGSLCGAALLAVLKAPVAPVSATSFAGRR